MNKALVAIALLVISAPIFSQSNIPVPEFENTVIFVDTVVKTSTALEKANGEIDYKVKALGYGGGDMFLKISGKSSPVSFTSNTSFVFTAKLPDPDTDPSTTIYLFKFTQEKDRRRVKTSSMKLGGKTRNVEVPKVELSFIKLTPGIYLIIPKETLGTGSYGFVMDLPDGSLLTKQTATVSAFDVQ